MERAKKNNRAILSEDLKKKKMRPSLRNLHLRFLIKSATNKK
jgi:hypothetical protein